MSRNGALPHWLGLGCQELQPLRSAAAWQGLGCQELQNANPPPMKSAKINLSLSKTFSPHNQGDLSRNVALGSIGSSGSIGSLDPLAQLDYWIHWTLGLYHSSSKASQGDTNTPQPADPGTISVSPYWAQILAYVVHHHSSRHHPTTKTN